MICSTCCNALIRKLESGLDRGQRITCGIDGWGSLQTVVECSHYLATVYQLEQEKWEPVGISNVTESPDSVTMPFTTKTTPMVKRTQSERMKDYWRKKREGK